MTSMLANLKPDWNRFHNLLSEVGENIIVILSTHIVEDVRNLCANMAVMNLGETLFNGKTSEALELLKNKIWQKLINKDELLSYKERYKIISTKVIDGKVMAHILADAAPESGFTVVEPDLEDVYFSYINKN